jgi:4-diphosphocytidyl-2-C-methyl-D-erythritol kinase
VSGPPHLPVDVIAPAKLTLSLKVTGVRADGYHLLQSEMVTLDLADTVLIDDRPSDEGGRADLTFSRDPTWPGTGWEPGSIPVGAENLVARALVAVGRTARVHVVKRVPPGAGLGGGSADAAAVLRWAHCTDLAVASDLGADVPFCLTGGRALVAGVGEAVRPLPHVDRQFLLLLPPFGVDTGAVYRAWDGLAAGSPRSAGTDPGAQRGRNDLESAALLVEPRLAVWRAQLEGLTGKRPQLAGSGSSWFVEGSAEESGLRDRQLLQVGDETGVLVAVRTTPSPAPA